MTKYTLHKISEGFIITSDEELNYGDNCVSIRYKDVFVFGARENSYLSECKKVIAQQDQIDFSNLTEEECKLIKLDNDYWVKGNRIRVTTIHDYESKNFLSKDRWVNKGKQIYEGFVIEVDKGLALQTDDGKIFKTQSTYWFGSILEQKIEIIEKAQELSDKLFTIEDLYKAYKEGYDDSYHHRGQYCFDGFKEFYIINHISWNVEVEITENKIKVLKLIK